MIQVRPRGLAPGANRRLLACAGALIVAFMGAEIAAGVTAHSLALLSDSAGIDPEAVGATLVGRPHVVEVHDLHVWKITSGLPAASAHVLVERYQDCHAIRADLMELLSSEFGITHATLQVDHVPSSHALERVAEHPEHENLRHCGDAHGPSYRPEGNQGPTPGA